MKKLLLSLSIAILASMAVAQQFPLGPKGGSTTAPGRDNEITCMPYSVFSQVYPTFYSAYYCQAGYSFSMVTDDYSAVATFHSLRFWGGDFYGCSLAPVEIFDIYIWDGNPNQGGNLIHTYSLPGTTTPIGINYAGTPLYQVDIEFGSPVNHLNGWIGITRTGASCDPGGSDYGFAWIYDNFGTGNSMSFNGSWQNTGSNMLFCLGGDAPMVPVSSWALFIGIGLIVVFTVIRFRKNS